MVPSSHTVAHNCLYLQFLFWLLWVLHGPSAHTHRQTHTNKIKINLFSKYKREKMLESEPNLRRGIIQKPKGKCMFRVRSYGERERERDKERERSLK